MKHLFIVNPCAGKFDRSHELQTRVSAFMAGRNLDWEIVVTRYTGHAIEYAAKASAAGKPLRIYACGGDGTLNECAAGAAGYANAAVTHYPMGSGNDFIRMFGPDAGRFQDLPALLEGPQAPADLIDCNGRLALNVCSVGLDARVGLGMRDFKRLPLVGGSLAYQLSTLRCFVQGIHRPYRVEVDGEELPEREFTLVCACNGRYYGGGFNPSRSAMPDDGALDFIVIRAVSRLTVAALIGTYAKGGAPDIPDRALVRRGHSLRVSCGQEEMVNLDGERMDAQDLTIRLSEKRVNFFFPQGAHWNPARRCQGGPPMR